MFMDDDTFPESGSADDQFQPSPESAPTENAGNNGGGNFSDEVYSKKIQARSRLFYIDLKESANGKFVKISEKSRGGQRSTVMLDEEDIDAFIEAFQEIKGKL